jgi:DHA3 family macrolide efflux protein-like MFS transporter
MRALLANPGFRRLWFSQVGLALGDAVMQMGLLEFFRAHGYAVRTEAAKLFFAVSLPGLVLGPLAVAYLGRWQRRTVMMVGDALRALIVVAIALWLLPVLTGRLEARGLMMVYGLVFLIGAITTFYFPARYALLPNLVALEQLVPANTLFTVSLAVAQVGGRALGGFVAERLGVPWALLANALAYVVSIALIWGIRMKPHATTRDEWGVPKRGWSELRAGLVYLWGHPTAIPLVLIAAVFAFLLGVFIVTIVGYAVETLRLGTAGMGYLFAPAGAGAAVGLAIIGRGKPWSRSMWLPFAQLIAVGVLLGLLSRTTSVWLAAALLAGLGAVGATVMIPIDAQLQAQVEDEWRGAVFAARGMMTAAAMITGVSLQIWTPLLQRTPAPTILLWLGVGAVVVSVLALLLARSRQP